MFDWDDLRYFLAVARAGSTIAAAEGLKVNQSTVQRRLAALEEKIGRRLVERQPTGYRLTDLGERMLAHAEAVEAAVAGFERSLAASETEISGTIRVTCPEADMYRLLTPLLEKLNPKRLFQRKTDQKTDQNVDPKIDQPIGRLDGGSRFRPQIPSGPGGGGGLTPRLPNIPSIGR